MQTIFFLKLPANDMNISENQDTLHVSERSHIADITFYDSANIVTRIKSDKINGFPFLFLEKNKRIESEARISLQKKLKDGSELPSRMFHEDWIVFIILVSAFFYASVQAFSKKLFPGLIRFFLFRGIGESESGDTGELFHWQSTLINLVSFCNIALFAYFTAVHFGVPAGSGFIRWMIALGVIIAAVTVRHIACMLTGRLSGKERMFNEYIITVYQAYRYLSIIFFIIVILLAYTEIFSPRTLFLAGYVSFGVLYLMRVIRLLLIFIKADVNILYWILYLCALEFLPVAVVVKYVTGLF